MTVTFERARMGEVPVLLARPATGNLPLPTVLWYHGLSADKDVHIPELQLLAEAGFLAVGVDAVGHGERRLPDFERQFSHPPAETDVLFSSLVAQSVAELPRLINALVDRGLSDPERLAIAGVSMGGYIVYGAIATDRRIRAAAALLGSPEWVHPNSPHHYCDSFFPTALLSITAEWDDMVPPEAARKLHRKLDLLYRDHPERLMYHEIPGAPHFMSPEDWASTVRQSIAWMARFVL